MLGGSHLGSLKEKVILRMRMGMTPPPGASLCQKHIRAGRPPIRLRAEERAGGHKRIEIETETDRNGGRAAVYSLHKRRSITQSPRARERETPSAQQSRRAWVLRSVVSALTENESTSADESSIPASRRRLLLRIISRWQSWERGPNNCQLRSEHGIYNPPDRDCDRRS